MSSLIAMAVFDTVENKRTELTEQTLMSLARTVNFLNHRLFIIDNNSCEKTKTILKEFREKIPFTLITNEANLGTASAVNQAWRFRNKNEYLVKMDNDVCIRYDGWADLLEEGIERMPDTIGILCAKRKDLAERPDVEGWAKSELKMLPQEQGQRNLVIEIVNHAMGTLQMYNHRLIDKIGGLTSMGGLYGFDDSTAGLRATKVGYISAFLCGIEIDHIDKEETEYTKWKQWYAGKKMEEYNRYKHGVADGTIDIYVPL